MLKFIFWVLLALNALWFAIGQGYLGSFKTEEHEPGRLKNQISADRLVVLTAAQAQQAQAAAVASAQAQAQAPEPATPATSEICLDVGAFRENEARRFEARLARLDLGEHQVRREVEAQDVTSYIVFIPPLASKEAAEKKAAELRALEVENFFIMNGDSPMKNAISLGVFKTQAAAETLLATLNKQGVHSAKMAGRGPKTTQLAYTFRGIDAATQARIEHFAAAYSSVQASACK